MTEIKKNDRALLVVAHLLGGGDPRFQWLYKWFDENAIAVTNIIMKSHYRHIDTLTGDVVTSTDFIDSIISNAQAPNIKALDVCVLLHGSPGKLRFDDGLIASEDLKTQLQAANLKHRLRLLYSTACYGATHVGDFIRAGFRVASGAKGICANGPYDYPAQLYNWKLGKTYKATVKAGNHELFREIHDTAAELVGFDDVDSEKVIAGRVLTRITVEAD